MNAINRSSNCLIVVDPNSADYDSLLADSHRTVLLASGHEALQADAHRGAIVWMINVRLPDMPGVELLKLLRRRLPRCAIFLVGDLYSIHDELTARLCGATAYLCKPASAAWLDGYLPRCRSPSIRAGPPPFS
jgi:DNA-binding response OmpR family regulator